MEITDNTTITLSIAMLGTIGAGVMAWARALARIDEHAKILDRMSQDLRELHRELAAHTVTIARLRERSRVQTDVFPVYSPTEPTPVQGLPRPIRQPRSSESSSDWPRPRGAT